MSVPASKLTVPPLRQRGVRGGFWVLALQCSARFLSFLRTVILARALAPEDFGLFGMALIALALLEAASQTGFQEAIVHKQRGTRYYDTVWILNVLRGMVLSTAMFLLAPLISRFFEQDALAPMLRVLAVSYLLRGFANVGTLGFQRDFQFGRDFVYQVVPLLLEFVVAVSAAFLTGEVWALVYGLLARSAATTALSHVLASYSPRWRLRTDEAGELFHFGKWLFGVGFLLFVVNHADRAIVGKVLGREELGFYHLAFVIGTAAAVLTTTAIARVMLPVYSRLRNEPERLRKAYLDVLELSALTAFPVTCCLVLFAEELTSILLGAKWLPASPLLRLLALKGLVWTLAGATGGALYIAMGRPDLNFKINLAQLLVFALFLYPATGWGTAGVCVVVVCAMLANYVLNVSTALRMTAVGLGPYLTALRCPVMASLTASGAALAIAKVTGRGQVLGAVASLATLGVVYLLWLWIAGKLHAFVELWSSLRGSPAVTSTRGSPVESEFCGG